MQAGSSEDGRDFAARYAEAIFTAQQTLGDAQEFYADIKRRARRVGRDPDHAARCCPASCPFIGSTEAEAARCEEEFDELTQPEYALRPAATRLTGVDLSATTSTSRCPRDLAPPRTQIEGAKPRYTLIVDIVARASSSTVRAADAAGSAAAAATASSPARRSRSPTRSRSGPTNGAADGFNVMPPWLPAGFEVFVDQVVPILRERGLFRTEYTGSTLRDHYGLDRPASQYVTTSTIEKETA